MVPLRNFGPGPQCPESEYIPSRNRVDILAMLSSRTTSPSQTSIGQSNSILRLVLVVRASNTNVERPRHQWTGTQNGLE